MGFTYLTSAQNRQYFQLYSYETETIIFQEHENGLNYQITNPADKLLSGQSVHALSRIS